MAEIFPKQKYYENAAKTLIKNLKKRQIEGYYCPNKRLAVEKALELIPSGSSIGWGGSMTLIETGLMDAIKNGELINIDGRENRVAFLCYGPQNVLILSGMNKVVKDIESGLKRARDIAGPQNAIRLNRKTPCAITGKCKDCYSSDCMCSQFVITRRSGIPNRIKIILIGEEHGY